MHKTNKFDPYHTQVTQELRENDCQKKARIFLFKKSDCGIFFQICIIYLIEFTSLFKDFFFKK